MVLLEVVLFFGFVGPLFFFAAQSLRRYNRRARVARAFNRDQSIRRLEIELGVNQPPKRVRCSRCWGSHLEDEMVDGCPLAPEELERRDIAVLFPEVYSGSLEDSESRKRYLAALIASDSRPLPRTPAWYEDYRTRLSSVSGSESAGPMGKYS